MKAFLRSVVGGLLALVLTASEALAQERPAFSQQELDQMLAPIALYPDPLLTQILMAATYPLEVVQAARWSRSNRHLQGQDAVRAVEAMDWDPSVKSLVAFPQILHRMDEQLEWTQRLGEAFLAQEPHVMDAIQGLRQRAEQAGSLRSSEQMRVTRQDGDILIEPAHPQVVYVPYYNPVVVYGTWWWPAYPPVYWGPPPGYVWPAYAPGFFWGTGIGFATGFFFGHFDWHHRHVKVVHVDRHHHVRGAPAAKPVKWQHDPVHRRNVPYRHTMWRQPFGEHPAMRGDERSRPVAGNEPRSAHPGTRSAAPQPRPQFSAPQPRPDLHPGRAAPQAGERWAGRSDRAVNERPQSRGPEPRPMGTVPRVGPLPRAVTPPPAARVDPRPYPPAEHARAAPRRESAPTHRAEPRSPAREGFMPPRAAASAPAHVPHASGNHTSGGVRAHGGGYPPARTASRGGGRS